MTTMRLPSRRMPPAGRPDPGFPGFLILAGLASPFGYLVYSASLPVRWAIAASISMIVVYSVFLHRREKQRFQALAEAREGESICEFTRSFNARETDTWVIRAVHQEIQQMLRTYVDAFPVRASDALLDDLRIDAEDVEDLVLGIAVRSGHSIENLADNLYYGCLHTVRDLVLFISTQPRHSSSGLK